MIEVYDKEGITVSDICQSLKRSKQTIYKVIAYFKAGQTAYDYYKNYKTNKKRCGRRQTQLTQNEQDFI
ncbi:helix-turn-helix domain-containing protein [Streptococcus pluranimalium]|uniref:helix-turn-helix domain-containing protein n=1 Tax=Streptococcus pluranimalium TaxID=82348 RepID=UPI0039FBD93C